MSRKFLIVCALNPIFLLSTSGCRSVSVHLGKRAAASELQSNTNTDGSEGSLYRSWNSMEDNIERLEELKKEGARAFLSRYKTEGRSLIRSGFRQLRDSISRNANTQHNYGLSGLGALAPGQCKSLDKSQDVFEMEDYGDIRPLLQTAVLSKIDSKDASKLNPSFNSAVDTVTKLVFFELGMKLDGASHFTPGEEKESISSDVSMQVIHEQDEPLAWQENDDKSLRLAFHHEKSKNGNQNLSFEASVGGDLRTKKASLALEFLRFNYIKMADQQVLDLKNGRSLDNRNETLSYSRRLALHAEANQHKVFILVDTTRYQLPGAMSRSYRIDLNKGQVCSLLSIPKNVPVPPPSTGPNGNGKGSDSNGTGDQPGNSGQCKDTNSPGQSKDSNSPGQSKDSQVPSPCKDLNTPGQSKESNNPGQSKT
ncbi:MAG: hypothetical protein NTX25_14715 [Proteobacteria bacterium]|nr:hypothetical protein [Pseudomonadota bacterium]